MRFFTRDRPPQVGHRIDPTICSITSSTSGSLRNVSEDPDVLQAHQGRQDLAVDGSDELL